MTTGQTKSFNMIYIIILSVDKHSWFASWALYHEPGTPIIIKLTYRDSSPAVPHLTTPSTREVVIFFNTTETFFPAVVFPTFTGVAVTIGAYLKFEKYALNLNSPKKSVLSDGIVIEKFDKSFLIDILEYVEGIIPEESCFWLFFFIQTSYMIWISYGYLN